MRSDDLDQKIRLFVGIVKQASQILRNKFDADFYVLFWDRHAPESQLTVKALRAAGIRIILVSDYIPVSDREAFEIPNEGHPSAAANEILAGGLSKLIMAK